MPVDPRSLPEEGFIEDIRQRFPVEKEVDRVLTIKMQNRAKGGVYERVTLEQLVECTEQFLTEQIGAGFHIKRPRWLAGGASKLQMAFELHRKSDSGQDQVTDLVLRMSPMEPVCETSFKREAQLVRALTKHNVIPVPECHWEDADAKYYPYPAIIYGFVTGVAKPTALKSKQVTGIGLNYGPDLRAKLGPQFIETAATLHTADTGDWGMDRFDRPVVGTNESVIKQINWWRRVWEEDRGEEEPIMQVAANWLIRNAPTIDHISIVHGDMRSGNFLFDEESEKITCWLDWELCSLGDRHEDLTWACSYHFGHYDEEGKDFLVSGLYPKDEFLARYEKASGLPVDPERMKFYGVFNAWRATIIVAATGYRVASAAKTHQDIVVTWLSGIGYLGLEELRKALEEVNV